MPNPFGGGWKPVVDWSKTLIQDNNNLYDSYAIMAYGARSHSKALGATAAVAGPFTAAGSVDLRNGFGQGDLNNLGASREDHSGQFNQDNETRYKYWNVLMKRFGLSPALGGRP